jgi:hypothetical protein
MKNTIRRFAAITAVTAALTGGLATAAFASGSPVQVSGTVNQSVTLSGLTSSIAFPATNPGASNTATSAEAYSVTSNDPMGYQLTITPGGFSMQDSAADNLPNNAISVAETTNGSGTGGGFQSNSALTVDTTNTSATKNYTENWSWTIPGNQPAGNYHEQFTYLALGE